MGTGWTGDTIVETTTSPASSNSYTVPYTGPSQVNGPPALAITSDQIDLNVYSVIAVEVVLTTNLGAYTFADTSENPDIVGASLDASSTGVPSNATLSYTNNSVTIDFHGDTIYPQIHPVYATIDLQFGAAAPCFCPETLILTDRGEGRDGRTQDR